MSRVNDPKQNFERLAKKRIDLMPEEIHIGYYTLDKYLPQWREMITHNPKTFIINNNYLLFPK
ncbi:MAG: ABC transporter substrate-binding protein, partial [Vibrio anguillarum]